MKFKPIQENKVSKNVNTGKETFLYATEATCEGNEEFDIHITGKGGLSIALLALTDLVKKLRKDKHEYAKRKSDSISVRPNLSKS